MSRTAQTAEKKSKRQQGADPDPVAIYKSPAKEVKRLLQAYPGLKVQHQQAATASLLTLPGPRRGSWNGNSSYDGSLQTTGGRISPGIQENARGTENNNVESVRPDETKARSRGRNVGTQAPADTRHFR